MLTDSSVNNRVYCFNNNKRIFVLQRIRPGYVSLRLVKEHGNYTSRVDLIVYQFSWVGVINIT